MIETPTAEYRRVLHLYARATKKDDAEVLNKFGKSVLLDRGLGVIKTTPVADKAKIERDFYNDGMGDREMAIRIAALHQKGIAPGKVRTRSNKPSIAWKKGAKISSPKSWQRSCGKQAKRLLNSRKFSAGYARSGWIQAAQKAGFSNRKPKAQFAKSNVGDGHKAKEAALVVELINQTKDITKVRGAKNSLYRAERAALKDMEQYAKKKLAQTAQKYSGK